MEQNALEKLTYGVFMVSTHFGGVQNGCIIDTCIQVANSPDHIAISVSNEHYTCELLKQSDLFAISILDESCTHETIAHFGFQCGRTANKFADFTCPKDDLDNPYLGWQTCGVLSCRVVKNENLGSHTLFIGEVVQTKVLSDKKPLSYFMYREKLK